MHFASVGQRSFTDTGRKGQAVIIFFSDPEIANSFVISKLVDGFNHCNMLRADLIKHEVVILIGIMAFFISCKKEVKVIYQAPIAYYSHLSTTNASPAISNLQFYLNNKIVPLTDSPFSYGNTTYFTYINNGNEINPDTSILPYITIPVGYQQLGFSSYDNESIFSILNSNFQSGGNYLRLSQILSNMAR